MKKIRLTIAACALLVAGGVSAQTIYDVNRYLGSDLNGTARFVGMGGAMGALGGDISTMSVNPAGIGIYRSNDFMLSFGFNTASTESSSNTSVMNSNKTKGSFDNIGFVYSNKIGNKTALKYINFGFNYHKKKNFNKSMVMSGQYDGFSQTDQMARMSSGRNINTTYPYGIIEPADFENKAAFTYDDVPWLGILGYNAQLIKNFGDPGDNAREVYKGYLPDDPLLVNGSYKSTESGGINVYDFNLSFNINDMFYIGGTLSAYDVDYAHFTQYSEGFTVSGNSQGAYTLNSSLWTEGAGVDFKLGLIVRPIAPLRIGFAVHTPTLFNLTDRNYSEISYNNIYDITDEKYVSGSYYSRDPDGGRMEMETDYRIITPWKYNVSAGYTLGKSIAIGAEYEYEDHSSAKLKRVYDDGFVENLTEENGMMKDMLKGVHTVRVGIEAKVVPQFSVRAGYNHTTAAFNTDAYKLLAINAISTNTDYTNTKAMNNYTLGMGYRGRMFYADLAYQFSTYKSDFYPFEDYRLEATKLNNDRHQLLMTLGVRF